MKLDERCESFLLPLLLLTGQLHITHCIFNQFPPAASRILLVLLLLVLKWLNLLELKRKPINIIITIFLLLLLPLLHTFSCVKFNLKLSHRERENFKLKEVKKWIRRNKKEKFPIKPNERERIKFSERIYNESAMSVAGA